MSVMSIWMRTAGIFATCIAFSGTFGASLAAQASEGRAAPQESAMARRSFALVTESSLNAPRVFWGYGDGEGVGEYARAHPGRYIVFAQQGGLYRLDNPAKIREAEGMDAPLQSLEARQKALAAEQCPLAAEQKALSVQMRAAVGAADMGRIGALQGAIGRQQGEIGAKQGEIGRRQGDLARAFDASVQRMIAACLGDGSCPRVGG